MQSPEISVVVPNFNHRRYLEKRLDSIVAQTFIDFELIILDDASTDGSLELIRSFEGKYPGTLVLISSANSGSPISQWDKALSYARGKYIWIAESDDFAHPDFLEIAYNVIKNRPDVGYVYAQSRCVSPEGNLLPRTLVKLPHATPRKTTTGKTHLAIGQKELFGNLLPFSNPSNMSGVLLDSGVLRKALLNCVRPRYTPDFAVLANCLLYANAIFIDRELNFYRVAERHNLKYGERYFDYINEVRDLCNQISPGISRAFGLYYKLKMPFSISIRLSLSQIPEYMKLIYRRPGSIYFDLIILFLSLFGVCRRMLRLRQTS